jgi:hypothetical protein
MKRTPAARHAGMRTELGAISNLGEKMKKLIGVAVLVCMTSLFGMAGEMPKPEVFGGYQFTSTDGGWHANGFSTSANFYIWKSIGITGDLGSGFSQGQSLYTYAVGPVLSHPKGNFSPYVHALFGGAHAGAAGIGVGGSTIMVGGGMDFGKHKLVFCTASNNLERCKGGLMAALFLLPLKYDTGWFPPALILRPTPTSSCYHRQPNGCCELSL